MIRFQRFRPSIFHGSFVRTLSREIFEGIQVNVLRRVREAPSKEFNDGEFYPGQVNIEITLHDGSGQKVDPLFQSKVITLDIYESIVRPVMFGQIRIADVDGLYERFPLDGDQFILATIKTPTREKESEYKFYISRRLDKQYMENNKRVVYTLELVTADFYTAVHKTTQARVFKGTIGDLIRSILIEDIQTQRPINIEQTTGIVEKTIETRAPFSVIHEHYLDAENSTNGHMVYAFFENKDGYNLISYEKLLKDGIAELKTGRSDKVFQFTVDRNADAGMIKFRNILAFNQSIFGGTLEAAIKGRYHNTAKLWSPDRGFVDEAQYIETEDGQSLPTSDEGGRVALSPQAVARKQQIPQKVMMIAVNPETRPNNRIAEVQTKRTAMISRMQEFEAQIMVYGDTDLKVGDVINCSFPVGTDVDQTSGESKYTSGNYLITHLRHMIVNSDQPQHAISCNLMKSGVKG